MFGASPFSRFLVIFLDLEAGWSMSFREHVLVNLTFIFCPSIMFLTLYYHYTSLK